MFLHVYPLLPFDINNIAYGPDIPCALDLEVDINDNETLGAKGFRRNVRRVGDQAIRRNKEIRN